MPCFAVICRTGLYIPAKLSFTPRPQIPLKHGISRQFRRRNEENFYPFRMPRQHVVYVCKFLHSGAKRGRPSPVKHQGTTERIPLRFLIIGGCLSRHPSFFCVLKARVHSLTVTQWLAIVYLFYR